MWEKTVAIECEIVDCLFVDSDISNVAHVVGSIVGVVVSYKFNVRKPLHPYQK